MSESQSDKVHNGLAWLVVSGLGGALSAAIVLGTIAGRLGVPLNGALFLGVVVLGALPRLLAIVRGRWAARWPELAAASLAAGSVVGIGLWLGWPDLLPPGRSVDSVLHYVLVRWIDEHQALPQGTDANLELLGEMAVYPPGLALVVVMASALSLQPPLAALYPTVALLGGLSAALVLLLASAAARAPAGWGTTPLVLVSTLLLLAHRSYTLGAYTDQNFYPMTLGVLLVLLAGGWLIVEPQLQTEGAAQLGLVIAALVLTYPLWSPVPAALAGLAILMRTPGWRRKLLYLALALLPAGVLAVVDVLPHLRIGVALLIHEGFVARPTPADLIPLALALPGVVLLLAPRRWWESLSPSPPLPLSPSSASGERASGRWLLVLVGLALGEMLGLYLAARLGLSAAYHSFKLMYVLTPLAAALAGAAVCTLAGLRRPAARLAGLGIAALLLAISGSLRVIPPPAKHPIDRDMVAAAEWLRAGSPEDARRAITVGGIAGPQPYWLLVGLLGQNRDAARAAFIATMPPTTEAWIFDERLPDVAVALNLDQTPPGATEAARFGRVAVLRRTGPLDAQALNPLVVRYRTFWEEERLKTAIELLHPVPGRLPVLELQLYQGDALLHAFPLQPDPQRARTQYLGVDVLPATLGGEGYVNTSDYPVFGPPPSAPSGPLALRLVLRLEGHTLDERLLATFDRADGRFQNIAPHSGELVYLRRPEREEGLREGAWGFGDALELTGWNATERAAPGGTAEVWLRWRAPRPIDRSLVTLARLVDSGGRVVAESASPPQGGFYPTWRWRPGEPVVERRALALPPDLAPGEYRLVAGVRDPAEADDEVVELGVVVLEE